MAKDGVDISQPATSKLGMVYVRRQNRIFAKMWGDLKSSSTVVLCFLVFMALLTEVVVYQVGLLSSNYYSVLGSKDLEGFIRLTVYAIEIIILVALFKSLLTYLSRLLYLIWRKNLCNHFHDKYFTMNNYYKLNISENNLDNIDQRLTRDANKQCYEWSLLVAKLVVLPFTITYYSYQCFVTTTFMGPITIYIYFIVGTIINRLLMVPVVKATLKQEKCEGDFRFHHLQVRVNAESIAFYQSNDIECYKTKKILSKLLLAQKGLYGWSYWLNSSVNIFDYFGGILSYLIIAVPIFGGKYDELSAEELSALISKNAFVCIYLIYCFSQLFDMMRVISDIAGHTHRLCEVLEFMDRNDQSLNGSISNSEVKLAEKDEHALVIDNVNVQSLGNIILIKNISMNVAMGVNVLITGPTGCGKTSLLRTLRGLLEPEQGSIKLNMSSDIFYFPQKPLFTCGTLREQLVYPSMDGFREYSLSTDIEKIQDVVHELQLDSLIEKVGGYERFEVNWSDTLSPGEMQQLTFVRLFYHNPQIAIMDEPTSAMDATTEQRLFNACKKRRITMITVGHNQTLKKFHHMELQLSINGKWSLHEI